MPFEPGQSGNPGGRPKHKPFLEALRMEELSASRGEECLSPPGTLRYLARQLLLQGDVQAIKEVADRFDGKVPQAVVGDNESDPINLVAEIRRTIVRATGE